MLRNLLTPFFRLTASRPLPFVPVRGIDSGAGMTQPQGKRKASVEITAVRPKHAHSNQLQS